MFENWIVLAVIAGLCSTIFNSILRATLKKGVDPTAYAWWFELIRASFFALILPFNYYFEYSLFNFLLLLALGFSEFVAVYLFMKMHAHNELSLSTIILQLRSVWVSLFALIFLGEFLSAQEWLGIIGVAIGAIIVSRPKVLSPDRGLLYALFMTIVSAISAIILKKTTSFASIPLNIFFFSFPSIILLPLFMKNARVRITAAMQPAFSKGLVSSLANIVGMFATALALRYGSPGLATGVFQGVGMLSLLVGIFIMGEKQDIVRKILGGAITAASILLLT